MTSLRHLRSDTANKRPDPTALSTGQVAINYESSSPGLFFKDSAGNLVKAGPVHIGTAAPNATPAAGGSSGNAVGEFWLDTTGGAYNLKVWDGSAWRSAAGEYVNVTGDTMTGDLTLDNANLVFEGSTADTFETTLTVVDPTADRTITLPNVSGTVVTTGDTGTVTSLMIANNTITNGDISPTAEIAVSKLADGTARQLLQTDAAGTGVEWTSNVDVPGTLDVTGAATFDSTASVTGDFAVNTNTLFVDASANAVGVGTTSPTETLTIAGTTQDVARIKTTAVNAKLFFEASGTTTSNYIQGTGNELLVVTNGGERARIDSSGRLLVGTSSDYSADSNSRLGIQALEGGRIDTTSSKTSVVAGQYLGVLRFWSKGGGGSAQLAAFIAAQADGAHAVGDKPGRLVFSTNPGSPATAPVERMRIDSAGRLLVGTSSSISTPIYENGVWGPQACKEQFAGITAADSSLSISVFQNLANGGAQLSFNKSRSTTVGTFGGNALTTNNELGAISFSGDDGSKFVAAASITCATDGTPGANDMPGRLVLSTTADGASSPTRRMTIKADGSLLVGNFDTPVSSASGGRTYIDGGTNLFYTAVDSGTVAYFNRNTNDGNIIELRQANTTEGAISVSGTTVTYGGGHLARWSQLPNNEDPSSIFKGTVMSNLDEMCEWGDEDNEQLNKTKISDVEGDPNVAGVFVATSFDEEGPLDFFVGMTGDMVIRIASGVSVQRGNLLMSAGDGTAKPQDDDIIRSKTIAKVISTTVSCTYDDGSYCVPCVLMAC